MSSSTIQILRRTIGAANWSSTFFGQLICWFFYPLVAIMVADIVARYLIAAPLIWVPDVSLWLHNAIFLLGGAYALLNKKHVTADLFYVRMSPRGQAIVDLVGYIGFFFPIVILLLPITFDMTLSARAFREVSTLTIWRPPLWPLRALIPLSLLLMLLQGLSEFIQHVVFVAFPGIKLLDTPIQAKSHSGEREMCYES